MSVMDYPDIDLLRIEISDIVDATAAVTCIQRHHLVECDRRVSDLVHLRRVMIVAAHLNGYSFAAIGRALNRDHTTAMHHVRVWRESTGAKRERVDLMVSNVLEIARRLASKRIERAIA